jgi:glucosamine--fructose-6-phosphate aminotransferase (isomerizing)
MDAGMDPVPATLAAMKRLHGAFAIALAFAGHPGLLVGARRGSPMAVGFGEGETYLGSDAMALAPLTKRIAYLEEGDCAVLTTESVRFLDENDRPVERAITTTAASGALVGKGNYRHFMQKEIFEHPTVIADTLHQLVDPETGRVVLPSLPFDLASVPKVTIIACGTSFYAGQIARYWIEQVARIPVETDIASEFRYRAPVLPEGGLCVFVSQSGETADTLAALRLAKQAGYLSSLAICNVPESSLVRESELVMLTRAGPEIGVASTKAFTTQLTALLMLVIALAKHHGADAEREHTLVKRLVELPGLMEKTLSLDPIIQKLALRFADKQHTLFLGRGALHPIAMEGALKLKEISYIHAEAYAAGELKHGPLALVDSEMPVIAVAPNNDLLEKLKSNLMEVRARGGELIVFADPDSGMSSSEGVTVITMPKHVSYVQAPIVYTIPLQLLSYHVAILKGTDVDQPRNLAKSVTVE